MPPPSILHQLVLRFEDNLASYRSPAYNETQLRREFLDPFFEALGWDVFNKQGYAEAYKDVVHEDAIKISGRPSAPDYAFRIGGTRKFFVEAKKPSVNIKEDISPSFQLRRYAWSAKLPLSILTDFEEFAVFDCRSRPDRSDKPSAGRLMMLTFRQYLDQWDELAAIFSREAVLKGSFDRYAETAAGKHGTAEVDHAFLAEIERWRELLARNIALRNPQLSQRALNYAVQMTIDRIIFLRIAEDRGIEPYETLSKLAKSPGIYSGLTQLYRRADERYNSGLFHFRAEKGASDSPDSLTLSLAIDDKPLKDILSNLYYPDSPYEFSVLPADILGQVYEQFLGKVIRLTAGRHAVVEDKPEVKKAGGVFYTPTYIVEYIVKHTLGAKLAGKQPADFLPPTSRRAAGGEALRVLDAACGSGSFLLGAYQYLLDWYRDGYIAGGPEKWAQGAQPRLVQVAGGEWKLTTAERKRILLEHIYGVDIDSQAVEVTKLSLLLKVLEGESEQTIGQQMALFHERALPDLGANIQCGNSLIGPDFYAGKQASFLDTEEQYRINAFDWEQAFPQVFKDGGFDVVIGNPPYIRIQALKEWAPREVEFYKQRYVAASKGNYDIYVVFVEKGLSLLNERGRLGFILPHKFFNAKYGESLREMLARGKHLAKVVHFGDQQVFENATTYTCLMFLNKIETESVEIEKVSNLDAWREALQSSQVSQGYSTSGMIPAEQINPSEWNFTVGKGAGLFEKLNQMPVRLEQVTSRIFQGIKTSADKIYIIEELERVSSKVRVYSRENETEYWLEGDLLHPLVKGGDSRRYYLRRTNRLILFPYAPKNGKVELITENTFKSNYPLTWEYLIENKRYLENREDGKMRGSRWYGYIYPKALDVMPLPKIFTPDIAARSSFSLDETGDAFFTGGVAGGYGIIVLPDYSREFILSLLNSRLLEWFIHKVATQMRGGYYSYESRFIRGLPIATRPLESPVIQRITALSKRMLALHQQLAAAAIPAEKTLLQRQVEITDRQIDELVYELYGLTDEEIRIVEGIDPPG